MDEALVAELNGHHNTKATLIRVNPALPLADRKDVRPWVLPIRCGGKQAVERIDAAMMRAGKSGTSSGQHDAAPLLIDGFATIGVGEPTSRELPVCCA